MIKRLRSVAVDTTTGQIFYNNQKIDTPFDVYYMFLVYGTYEYLKENYINSDETLWQLATETREIMSEDEANGYPITEGEAIEIACNSLNITLEEV